MDRGHRPADGDGAALPGHPDLSLFVATLFQRLGGKLEIDEAGRRQVRRPHRLDFDLGYLPQLAGARPWERFASRAEWDGAMKLAEYWLSRLGDADRNYVFTLLADPEIDARVDFDFRQQL